MPTVIEFAMANPALALTEEVGGKVCPHVYAVRYPLNDGRTSVIVPDTACAPEGAATMSRLWFAP